MMDQHHQIIALVAMLAAIPIIISSLEYLYLPQQLKEGLMAWELERSRRKSLMTGVLAQFFDFFLVYPTVLYVVAARLILAIMLIVFTWGNTISVWLLLPLTICDGIFFIRTRFGRDGADHMTWITLITLTLTAICPTKNVITAALWFLSFQICLSYFSAGWLKATAVGWRNGRYIASILNLKTYGNPIAGKWILRNKKFAPIIGWSVIIWECTFFLIFIVPKPMVIPMLISGLVFHLLNAVNMGLNCFFFSFVALYPCIYFLAMR